MAVDKEVHKKLDALLKTQTEFRIETSTKLGRIDQHLKDINGRLLEHDEEITTINKRCIGQMTDIANWRGSVNVKLAVIGSGAAVIGGLIYTGLQMIV